MLGALAKEYMRSNGISQSFEKRSASFKNLW